MPASRRRKWIDPGLPARDRDRARGHLRPGNVPPRQLELFWQRSEVGPSGYETDEEDAVDGTRMDLGDLRRRQPELGGDLLEVWAVVADGDPVQPAWLFHRRTPRGERTCRP